MALGSTAPVRGSEVTGDEVGAGERTWLRE
jgi:hypothetical protein